MATTVNEFVQGNAPNKFDKEAVVFSETGDFLTVYFSDDDAYTRRIDDLVTVYYSEATNELVGCKVKGVRRLVDEMGSLGVTLTSDEISVWVLIANSFDLAEMTPEYFRDYQLIQQKTRPVRIERSMLAAV